MSRSDRTSSELGMTLVELMVAIGMFMAIIGILYGSLGYVDQQANNSLTSARVVEAGALALNRAANEVRDLSDTYDNSFQAGDGGNADIMTMSATELQFLSGNNIVNNDAAAIVDPSGGSFTTGCADLIDIKLVSGNLVQTDTAPVLTSGVCVWTAHPVTVTLAANVEPLCSGSPCAAGSAGATVFSYLQSYPNQAAPAVSAVQVGEVLIGFAVLPPKGSRVTPVALTQTVRLGAVLSDPSS